VVLRCGVFGQLTNDDDDDHDDHDRDRDDHDDDHEMIMTVIMVMIMMMIRMIIMMMIMMIVMMMIMMMMIMVGAAANAPLVRLMRRRRIWAMVTTTATAPFSRTKWVRVGLSALALKNSAAQREHLMENIMRQRRFVPSFTQHRHTHTQARTQHLNSLYRQPSHSLIRWCHSRSRQNADLHCSFVAAAQAVRAHQPRGCRHAGKFIGRLSEWSDQEN
jgi:hypothetical protein